MAEFFARAEESGLYQDGSLFTRDLERLIFADHPNYSATEQKTLITVKV